MKILITGGAGFIGSNIADRFIEDGNEVIVVDDLSSGNEKYINQKARFYKLDIQDPQLNAIFEKEQPDYVDHHAAQINVRRSVTDPIYDAQINILGTLNVLQNCIKHNVKKVIFASTGGAIYGEQEEFPAPETHGLKPISPYGVAKLAAENYLYYYHQIYGLQYSILRYANVYGPRQDPHGEAGVIAVFIKKMMNGDQPVINGDGRQTRDFVYVGDVAEANYLALKSDTEERIFNIGTALETDINMIFNHLRSIINSSAVEKHGPPKKGEQQRSVITYTRAREILGWTPRTLLVDGLRKTYKYFKINE